jgi:serpin B
MNSRDEKYLYGKDKVKVWVTLPYTDEDFVMHIILPKSEDEVVIKSLENYNLNETKKTKLGILSIPKFKINTSVKLKEYMKSLGLKDAFTFEANFKNMTNQEIKISEIFHQSTMELDEKGTVATGSTAVVMVTSIF